MVIGTIENWSVKKTDISLSIDKKIDTEMEFKTNIYCDVICVWKIFTQKHVSA